MRETTHPQGLHTSTISRSADSKDRQDVQPRHHVAGVCWVIALLLFVVSCFVIHMHPRPYTLDLSTMQAIQGFQLWPWVDPVLEFPSKLNDPLPSAIALGCWLAIMVCTALFFRLRRVGTAALTWFMAACFLLVTVMSSAGLNTLVDILVGRPRPNPRVDPIHVHTAIVPFPTYPSGHTEHDIVYYGFLLYLSFARPVRASKYRWLLLPLQLYAVFDILSIGYSRILEGDHWLTDVLGGYLEGVIYLLFFIFLYRWSIALLERRRARKHGTYASAR